MRSINEFANLFAREYIILVMVVLILIGSTILSIIATGVIVINGLQKEQKTSTTSTAQTSEAQLSPTKIPSPTPPTGGATPTTQASPTSAPVNVIIAPYVTATSSATKTSIFLTFNQVSGSKSALYKLTYKASGIDKAAQGNITFKSTDNNKTKELILGVCSGSSCTYDKNVANVKIEVTFTQNDSSTSLVTYPYTL